MPLLTAVVPPVTSRHLPLLSAVTLYVDPSLEGLKFHIWFDWPGPRQSHCCTAVPLAIAPGPPVTSTHRPLCAARRLYGAAAARATGAAHQISSEHTSAARRTKELPVTPSCSSQRLRFSH